MASTTSFTVPPSAERIARMSAKGRPCQAKRRSVDSGALNGVLGAGLSKEGSAVVTAPVSCRARALISVGRSRPNAESVKLWAASVKRSRTASSSRVIGSGSGRGCHGVAGGVGGSASGVRS